MRQEATNDASRLPGWFPVRFRHAQASSTVTWQHPGTHRFREPFFEDTFRKAQSNSAQADFELITSVETLEAFANSMPAASPRGFIFHLSRCGSTLVSQILAALPRNVVISENPCLDDVLQAGRSGQPVARAERMHLLRLIVHALGQRRFPEEQDLFIKFDAWHTLDLPLILESFPGVPWIFVYRAPEEILVSHTRRPGRHMVPGLLPPGLLPPPRFGPDIQAPLAECGARALAAICDAVLANPRPALGRLIHYRNLPEAMFAQIADWFGLNLAPEEIQTMREITAFSAKSPGKTFAPERQEEQARITPELRAIANQYAGESYRRLEKARSEITALLLL